MFFQVMCMTVLNFIYICWMRAQVQMGRAHTQNLYSKAAGRSPPGGPSLLLLLLSSMAFEIPTVSGNYYDSQLALFTAERQRDLRSEVALSKSCLKGKVRVN
jgi:hypothetical protein